MARRYTGHYPLDDSDYELLQHGDMSDSGLSGERRQSPISRKTLAEHSRRRPNIKTEAEDISEPGLDEGVSFTSRVFCDDY